ncbi:MAG: glycosyltransferase [Deltaproteobacteria bacterium]|nr:glycosyltransferase [Deltaproteobacteria bacterium]
MKLAILSPALDEEGSVADVVTAFLAEASRLGHEARFIVCDNGSRDRTVERARAAGAVVVVEPQRGYGAACLRGLQEIQDEDAVVFVDADGACDPADLAALLAALARADLVIGSRTSGQQIGRVDDGALTAGQRAGSVVAGLALRWLYGVTSTDLGPFRVVRVPALRLLDLDDRGFGWTVQMQARAARQRLRVVEVPVGWRRRRAGQSKISGDIRASIQAGHIILFTLVKELLR